MHAGKRERFPLSFRCSWQHNRLASATDGFPLTGSPRTALVSHQPQFEFWRVLEQQLQHSRKNLPLSLKINKNQFLVFLGRIE
jgi:hypothetical protein